MYVPANWRHMTLNIGESIGVGGQAVYGGEVNRSDGLVVVFFVFCHRYTPLPCRVPYI